MQFQAKFLNAAKRYTPEQVYEAVEPYEASYGAMTESSPGYGRYKNFTWSFVSAFPISKLSESPDWWNRWYSQEQRMKPEYYTGLERDYKRSKMPVVIAEGTDGKFYVWDGRHRVGITCSLGQTTIPAFVGIRKPEGDEDEEDEF